jgi:hypothetical protein
MRKVSMTTEATALHIEMMNTTQGYPNEAIETLHTTKRIVGLMGALGGHSLDFYLVCSFYAFSL